MQRENKMNTKLTTVFLALAIIAAPVIADDNPSSSKIKLNDKELYFTEPYVHLEPPVTDVIGMCLDLDYALVKYVHGFVNTLTDTAHVITHKKRIPILVPDQLERVQKMSELKLGEPVTVVSARGKSSNSTNWPVNRSTFS